VTMHARFLAVCCVASLVLIVPATAGATASSSLGNGSGVAQYTQKISNGGGKPKKTRLDRKSASTLKHVAKPAQKVLKAAITSSWGGASAKLDVAKTPRSGSFGSSLVGSLLGTVSYPGAGSGNRLVVLLVAIVSITAALGIAAARKQRALRQIQH
jgi:hypothetical protein